MNKRFPFPFKTIIVITINKYVQYGKSSQAFRSPAAIPISAAFSQNMAYVVGFWLHLGNVTF